MKALERTVELPSLKMSGKRDFALVNDGADEGAGKLVEDVVKLTHEDLLWLCGE